MTRIYVKNEAGTRCAICTLPYAGEDGYGNVWMGSEMAGKGPFVEDVQILTGKLRTGIIGGNYDSGLRVLPSNIISKDEAEAICGAYLKKQLKAG